MSRFISCCRCMVPAIVLSGCAAVLAPEDGSIVFVAQDAAPSVVMDALFQGSVTPDAAGCLRLDGPSGQTVVWPFGSRLETRDGGTTVVTADGRSLGRIGGDFRFGGGEAPQHDGLPIAEADQARLADKCPGKVWLVGEH